MVGVILPAAGTGNRFGEKKQFITLGTRPLYLHALQPFLSIEDVKEIVIAVPEEDRFRVEKEILPYKLSAEIKVVSGGERRQDSVQSALRALSDRCTVICIHDVARPFITADIIEKCVQGCDANDGAITAIPANDTLKQVDKSTHHIESTLDRERIWHAQTPQAFKRTILQHALQNANEKNLTGTDEAALAEVLGYTIAVVPGSPLNQKITTQEDWEIAEAILHQQRERE